MHIILEKNDQVSDLITSSLPTVGLRCPNHSLTLELLEDLAVPLAAPSANKFSKTSPTTPKQVQASLPDVEVLDGGVCEVGIESTILQVEKKADHFAIAMLRPGMIQKKQIQEALSQFNIEFKTNQIKEKVVPGSLEDHYMPSSPLVIVEPSFNGEVSVNEISKLLNTDADSLVNLELPVENYLAARVLYTKFHDCKDNEILLFKPQDYMGEDWEPILDRIYKASTLILN